MSVQYINELATNTQRAYIWHEDLISRTGFVLTFSCFSPLLQKVLVAATVVLKHTASMISDSQDHPLPVVLFWLLLKN